MRVHFVATKKNLDPSERELYEMDLLCRSLGFKRAFLDLGIQTVMACTPRSVDVKLTDEYLEPIDFDADADIIALSAKNAILIVEVARELRAEGKSIMDSAVEAARARFRPILMTSFAFILGVLPLVISSGSGSEMRQAVGVAVFFGMIGVTLFGLLFTPIFYVVVRNLADRGSRRGRGPNCCCWWTWSRCD